LVVGDEECDDGNTNDGDSCDHNCNSGRCGNGILTSGEECDDGNISPCDGCSAVCQLEGFCGDGELDLPCEQCDDGNTNDGDGCSSICEMVPRLISGKKLIVKDKDGDATKRAIIVQSRDSSIAAPLPDGVGDPTVIGAELCVMNTATPEEAIIALPAEGWTGLGNPAGSKGYKFSGRAVPGSPCKSVLVRAGKLKAVCKGNQIGFTLDEASQAPLAVTLRTGAGSFYCMEFGGAIRKDKPAAHGKTGMFMAKDAPAPLVCPMP
jgi:cysteine-rich repeat protein